VTHKADAEARRLIRSVRRGNPDCRLLVTGCYAELEAERLAAMDGVDRVFGNREKAGIGAILDELGIAGGNGAPGDGEAPERGRADRGCDAALDLPSDLHFGDRSRAFLKVQEGCRLVCSYCIIPRVRGESRSVEPRRLEIAALELFEAGYREIVLTGVNTGDYGLDLNPRTDLASLLRRLLAACGPNRIRLNSLEPLTVSDELIELLAGEPRLAPHLQVPLQSGSPAILRAMRRNYRLDAYLERLVRLRAAVPHAGIGADAIVGFPGETEERFRETLDFVESSPLNYLHVFSWSPRPGTTAAGLPDRVPVPEIRERSRRLRALGERLSFRFRKRFEGHCLDGVALGPTGGGRSRVLTGNFIECELAGPAPKPRSIVGLRIERVTPGVTLAAPADPPGWAETGPGRHAAAQDG
jgi:threonylcarbamoyladenosine tRNA methylthiotransferase MtaB